MDKQTQKQRLLKLFADNGNQLSLGMIMQTDLAAEYRARISDLRNEGHEILCTIDHKEPSNNLYTYYGKKLPTPETHTEALQSTQAEGNSNVWDRGTFRGLQESSGIVQVKIPCNSCGSYYRRDGKCNICGRVDNQLRRLQK